MLLTKLQILFGLHQFFHWFNYLTFSFHVSLVSSNLQFLSRSLPFVILTFLSTEQLFVGYPSCWVCLILLMTGTKLCVFLAKWQRWDVVSFLMPDGDMAYGCYWWCWPSMLSFWVSPSHSFCSLNILGKIPWDCKNRVSLETFAR